MKTHWLLILTVLGLLHLLLIPACGIGQPGFDCGNAGKYDVLPGTSVVIGSILCGANVVSTSLFDLALLGVPPGISTSVNDHDVVSLVATQGANFQGVIPFVLCDRETLSCGSPGQGTFFVSTIPPSVLASASPATIVVGDSSHLLGKPSGGSPPYAFRWSPTGSLDNPSSDNPVARPTTTTTYTITVKDSAKNAMSATATVTVTVVNGSSPPPVASFTLTWLDFINLRVDASASTSGAPITRYEYTQAWFGDPNQPYDVCYYPAGFPSNGCQQATNPAIYTFAGGYPEMVRVRIVDANNRSDSTTRNTTPPPALSVTASANPATISQSNSTQSQLTALVQGGVPPYSYSWAPATGLSATNVAAPIARPAATTTYTLTVTDFAGMSQASNPVTVTVVP